MLEKARLKLIMRKYLNKEKTFKAQKPAAKAEEQGTVPLDPYRYEVFKKVCPGGKLFIFFPAVMVGLLVVVPVIVVLKSEWLMWIALLLAVLLVLQIALNMIRFLHYFKKWDKKLPYRLKGWPELIQSKKIYCDLCWTDITVTVIPKEHALPNHNSAEDKKWIEAALALLARRAQKAFYQAEIGTSDKRKKWESNKLSASGSANPDVLKSLKTTCQKELAYINRNHSAFSEVQISIDSGEYQIPIEITSSEGTAS